MDWKPLGSLLDIEAETTKGPDADSMSQSKLLRNIQFKSSSAQRWIDLLIDRYRSFE